MNITTGQEEALKNILQQYANDDGCTVYGATLSILSILRVDADKTLRDEFAMAALTAADAILQKAEGI